MATVDDVTLALANEISNVVYPNGTDALSVASVDIAIVQGWPIPKDLDDFVVKGGKVLISVYPGDTERNVTRGMGTQWQEISNNGVTGESLKEVKRQERVFQVTVWADTPAKRSLVVGKIDAALAELYRFKADSYSVVNMSYLRYCQHDELQMEGTYRGDFFYQIEYPTTIVETDQVVQHTTLVVKSLLDDSVIASKTD